MSETFRALPVGDHSVLLELESNASVHAAAALARERFGDRLIEIVPGHQTLLLVSRESALPDICELMNLTTARGQSPAPGTGDSAADTVSVPVRYDGEDLEAVAQRLGVDRERVIELHCAPLYTVAFMGFAPGFPYLLGLAPELELPRLELPRQQVPAGSVAVAAAYCGIYPRSSPGGWNLLGRTDLTLFEPGRDQPTLLAPGDHVRFEPV